MRLALGFMLCALAALAANIPGDACKSLLRHGKKPEAKRCFSGLLQSGNAFARAEGNWALGQTEAANTEFREALKSQPKEAVAINTEWGAFFLSYASASEAAKSFQAAAELDANYAPAYLGMARVAADAFDKKAVDFAQEALKRDGKLYQAHELLAYLALEDGKPKDAADEAQKAIGISNEALDGMAVLAAIDWLDGKADSEWMSRILKINPAYGQAYQTGGHFFEINRRYDEAIASFRKAIDLDPELWQAHSELGVNLMRLGEDDEAKRQLEEAYQAHFRSSETVNALRLLDRRGEYATFKTPTTEIRLHKKEAELLHPYFQEELDRSIAAYSRKYKMTLPGPVRLEVFPNHDDFVVHTLGLPGQGGLLGVTFGLPLAMDSPTARPAGSFVWASTLWHEMSHVFVLTATHHLAPRWFGEGLAVHEEGVASSDWGDRMAPDIVSALQKKQLLGVLELDRGFLRPTFPTQVLVSYYEAGKMCDFIAGKWGEDAFVGMIHSYAAKKTTAEAISENLHEDAAAFNKEFFAWLDEKTGAVVAHFDDWKKGMKTAHSDFAAGKVDDALREAIENRDRFPDYVGGDNAYELMATIYVQKNNKSAAMEALERYRTKGGTSVEALKRLASLETETGNEKQAELTLAKLNYIYPEDEEVHRRLGTLLLKKGDASGAVREGKALIALKPADLASSHYELAKALRAANRLDEAKDQTVLALEAAPGFKPAQQLLLQLSQ